MGQTMSDHEVPRQTVGEAGEAYRTAVADHEAAQVSSDDADTASTDAHTALGEAADRQQDAEDNVILAYRHAREDEG